MKSVNPGKMLAVSTYAAALLATSIFGMPAGLCDPEQERVHMIDELFQTGLKLLRENHPREAQSVLQKAVIMAPKSAGIHCNLGLAMANAGELTSAIAELNEALRLNPRMPDALINLASCYQATGNSREALRSYSLYLRDNPGDLAVRDTVNAIESLMWDAQSDPRGPNYLKSVLIDGALCWSSDRLPLKIYCQPGDSVNMQRNDKYHALFFEALKSWIDVTAGKLSFTEVTDRNQADITCQFADSPESKGTGHGAAERGISRIESSHGKINSCRITIFTEPIVRGGELSDSNLRKSCLHEIGHALGLSGHSTNNHDVMFYTVDSPTVLPALTERDKNTLNALYAKFKELEGKK